MRRGTVLAMALWLGGSTCLAEAPPSGTYADGRITVDLAEHAGSYAGTIRMGDQRFPLTALVSGQGIDGLFTAGGHPYAFTASLDGATLHLTTGSTRYDLRRADPAGGTPAAQAAAAPAAGAGPAGYTVLAATESGRSLVAERANVGSVKEAFDGTLAELATYFGAQVSVASASRDIKDPNAGTATFSVSPNGRALRGLISCQVRDGGGASVAVAYASATATPAEWAALLHPPKPAAGAAAAPPRVPALAEYDFPDGTGSVGLAKGWTCAAQSGMDPVTIVGPDDQKVFFATSVMVNLPTSSVVQVRDRNDAMMQQTRARGRQSGIPQYSVPAAAPLLVAPLADPLEELKALMPQFSALSQYNHGPAMSLDAVLSCVDAPAALEGGRGANITYDTTIAKGGVARHFRNQMNLQVTPSGQEAWQWFSKGITAPVERFDADQPLMTAMFRSIKLDAARMQQVAAARNLQTQQFSVAWVAQYQQNMQATAQQWQRDQEARNAAWQKRHEETQAGYDRRNAETAAALLDRQRNYDDQIERVRGTVELYDTQNGHGTVADANDPEDIINRLYQADMDPNTTVRIPLRDKIDPLPGR
jgi:hypothetical protein